MHPIEARDLTVIYRPGLLARPATGLDGLDLTVEPGEVFGYIGANGAGKTTTIKTLLGLIRPTRGEALLFGLNSKKPDSRRDVGFLPEAPYFYEYLTGRETVEFYARLSAVRPGERSARAGEALVRVGLEGAADRQVKTYSRGMRQRLGLAQAIVHGPRLVILDEPMSGLDPLGRRDVRVLIQEVARGGATVFFSSHILSDVEALCDRVGVVARGKLVAAGRVEELARARVKTVELRCTGVPASDLAPLGDAVLGSRVDGDVLTFEVADAAAADRAARLVMERGGSLRALAPVTETLEEVFARLQKGREDVPDVVAEAADRPGLKATADERG
ncbi:MAG: ABC transporter ATP-binding protein [Planctomycetota bacterium]|jgi:ABC-2 type transport system ATP-binding protein